MNIEILNDEKVRERERAREINNTTKWKQSFFFYLKLTTNNVYVLMKFLCNLEYIFSNSITNIGFDWKVYLFFIFSEWIYKFILIIKKKKIETFENNVFVCIM